MTQKMLWKRHIIIAMFMLSTNAIAKLNFLKVSKVTDSSEPTALSVMD